MGDDTVIKWTPERIRELKRLARPKTLFMKEIAEQMRLPVAGVRHKMRRLGIAYRCVERYGKWNTKHAHLRESAMTFFLNHTLEETRQEFGLTESELKSLFTIGYRKPEYRHLRKDRRRRDPWNVDETLFYLRHAGLKERNWIAGKLKRGGYHTIKDQNRHHLHGIWSKQMHGLPLKTACELLGRDDLTFVRTNAGPISDDHSYRYRTVPWVILADETRWKRHVSEELRSCFRAMSRFQRWIYGTKTTRATMRAIERAIGGHLGKRRRNRRKRQGR